MTWRRDIERTHKREPFSTGLNHIYDTVNFGTLLTEDKTKRPCAMSTTLLGQEQEMQAELCIHNSIHDIRFGQLKLAKCLVIARC